MILALLVMALLLMVPLIVFSACVRDSSNYIDHFLYGLTVGAEITIIFAVAFIPLFLHHTTPDFEKNIGRDVGVISAMKKSDGSTYFLMDYRGRTYRFDTKILEPK